MRRGLYKRWICKIRVIVLVSIFLIGWGSLSRAQLYRGLPGAIRLFSPKNSYSPGEELFIYILFFRIPDMAFFSPSQVFRDSRDFKLIGYEKISGAVETGYDSMGFPEEFYTILYRVKVKPTSDRETLSFGPISLNLRMGFRSYKVTSNELTFYKRQTSLFSSISSKLKKSPAKPKLGERVQLRFELKCPRTLCRTPQLKRGPYQNSVKVEIPRSDQVMFLRDTLKISQNIEGDKLSIAVSIYAYPLSEGELYLPPLKLFLPIIQKLDQRKILREIYSWLTTQGISRRRAQRLVTIPRPKLEITSNLEVVPPLAERKLTVSPGPLCQGNWSLASSRTAAPDGTALWWLHLSGDGLFSLTLRALKKAVEESCTRGEHCSKLKLAHYRWVFPRREPKGSIEIDLLFRISGPFVRIPPIELHCKDRNRNYTLRTVALSPSSPVKGLPFSPQLNKSDYRLYLKPETPLSYSAPSELSVFLYAVEPAAIPLALLLSQRLTLLSTLELERVQRFAQVIKTSSQQGPFGSMVTTFTRTVPIWGYRSSIKVKKKRGSLFNIFPVLHWGQMKIAVRMVSTGGLYIRAYTDRDKYFVGEPINYTLEILCSPENCPDRPGINYGEFFRKELKLPKLEVYPGLKILENLERAHREGQWVIFRYRVQFPAPSAPKISLRPAVMRLTSQRLLQLYRQHKVCLFYSDEASNSIENAVAKDHFDSQGGGRCSVESRQLSTSPLELKIQPLPREARGIKLIGEFSISVRLSQLEYPLKRATTTDKPFFLSVELTGEGDLDTAIGLIQDQLREMTAKLQKKGAVCYIENVENWPGGRRIRVQIIAEKPGKIEIPSLKIKYFHREEGVVTAESLPLTVNVEPRRDGKPKPTIAAKKTDGKENNETLDSDELRPILPLPPGGLKNEGFELLTPLHLGSLGLPLLLFLLFSAWLRYRQILESDPQRLERARAFSTWRKTVSKLDPSRKEDLRTLEQATISYFVKRFSLKKRSLTVRELEALLRERFPRQGEEVSQLISMLKELEEAIYGGEEISEWREFIARLEKYLKKFK